MDHLIIRTPRVATAHQFGRTDIVNVGFKVSLNHTPTREAIIARGALVRQRHRGGERAGQQKGRAYPEHRQQRAMIKIVVAFFEIWGATRDGFADTDSAQFW